MSDGERYLVATALLSLLPVGGAEPGVLITIDGFDFVFDGENWTNAPRYLAKGVDPQRESDDSADMVNHPKHYLNNNAIIELNEHECFERDGKTYRPVECIELMRRIKDPRVATAFKYVWRIAFGGKFDDDEDAGKGVFYLNDFTQHKVD